MTLFRFCGFRGSTLLSVAIYRGHRGRMLFVWYGNRVLSIPLWRIPWLGK